jgi:hypothetical protein
MAEAMERGGQTRGELWQFLRRVSDSREEGLQPSLLVTGRRRDAVSEHRGLSSGVASGKSIWSRYAYGWVETSTPLSSRTTSGVISDKCFTYILHLEIHRLVYVYICS